MNDCPSPSLSSPLQPGQPHRVLAGAAPRVRASSAAVRDRLPRRRGGPEVALRRRGRLLRGRLAGDHGGEPVPRRHGPGVLPPVPDSLQPGRAGRGRRDQQRRAVPRRPGLARAGPCRSPHRRPDGACSWSAPALPASPRHTTCGCWGTTSRSGSGDRGRRHDALRHPALPAAPRGPGRRDRPHPRDGGAPRAGQRGRRHRGERGDGGYDAAFLAVGAGRAARLHPAADSARILDAVPLLHDVEDAEPLMLGRRVAVTAAATPRSTPLARPVGWAPPTRSSSTGAPATGCRPRTPRSRRPSRRASCSRWLSTIKHVEPDRIRVERMGLGRVRVPAADR